MGTLWKFCQRKTHFPADILNILSYYLSKSDKQLQRYGRHKKSDLCHPRGKPKVKVIPKVLSAMHNYWVNMSSNLQRKRFSSFCVVATNSQASGRKKIIKTRATLDLHKCKYKSNHNVPMENFTMLYLFDLCLFLCREMIYLYILHIPRLFSATILFFKILTIHEYEVYWLTKS